MAEEIGISLTSYKNYESGTVQPNMENLVKIADVLDMSIDELCGRWNTEENQELMIRMKKVENLDEDEKKVINTVLDSILIRHYSKGVIEG